MGNIKKAKKAAARRKMAKKVALLPFHLPKKIFHISRMHYFPKMKGGHPSPQRAGLLYILVSWMATFVAISALSAVSNWSNSIMIIAPFGATCVLLFAAPESPLAQPRNVIGGHVIATIISLVILHFLGNHWWVLAFAVATAIAAMQVTRTLHPPAGADPLVVILTGAPWSFVVAPVLVGAVTLVLCAVITNNFAKDRHYPKYWW